MQAIIDLEADNVRLLLVIEAFGSEMKWSLETLTELLGWTTDRACKSLKMLINFGLLTANKEVFGITEKGIEYAAGAIINSESDARSYMFKNEVLTGMDLAGNQTVIANAALPSSSSGSKRGGGNVDDSIIDKQESLNSEKENAEKLGLSLTYFRECLKSGRVHLCSGDHLGIFDKHGNGWQHLCKVCRKKAELIKCGDKLLKYNGISRM